MGNEKSHTEKFEELCAGYVLQALEEEERKEFEQMLEEASEEERLLYQNMRSTANQLSFAVERQEPSFSLKDELMTEIRSESDEGQSQNNVTSIDEDRETDKDSSDEIGGDEKEFNWPAFAAAASFALLIITLSLLFYSFNLSSEIQKKESVIAQKETQISELKSELQQKEEMLAILESRDVNLVLMSGMEVNPDGYGKIIWDDEKQQALLQVSNLPPVPENKDYQLWLIKDNKPISAGVFAVNEEDDKFFKIEKMAEASERSANAFAVTMEPKGGVPQPTGDMYLMGNMENK